MVAIDTCHMVHCCHGYEADFKVSSGLGFVGSRHVLELLGTKTTTYHMTFNEIS